MTMTSNEYSAATINILDTLRSAEARLIELRERVLSKPSITLQSYVNQRGDGDGKDAGRWMCHATGFGLYLETGWHDSEQAARDELAMMTADWAVMEWRDAKGPQNNEA